MLPPQDIARQRLLSLARGFMCDAMGMDHARVRDLLEQAAGTERWIEFAHTPQMPHLGVVRTLLVARHEALHAGGVLVLFLNDQLPPRDLPESQRLTLVDHGAVESPALLFAPPGNKRKWGMNRLPAPAREQLDGFLAQWRRQEPEHAGRIGTIGQNVNLFARMSPTYAGFLGRLMTELSGVACAVFPASALPAAFPETASGLRGQGRLWAQCSHCGYRLGRSPHEGPCPVCSSDRPADEAGDVLARQFLANLAGLHLRVCGRAKPYQQDADDLSRCNGVTPPPRLRVTGGVRVSDPQTGEALDRVNLLQYLGWGGSAEELARLAAEDAAATLTIDLDPVRDRA